MQLIETHAHLYLDEFRPDRDQSIQRARAAGVSHVILPAIDLETLPALIQLAEDYPDYCLATIGLHPTSVDENFKEVIQQMEIWLEKQKIYAIGETGIDLYWDKTRLDEQQKAFALQLEMGLRLSLPVIIHCRNSFDAILEVLQGFKKHPLSGVFHCFPGNAIQAEKVMEFGFHLGIGGVVTFKNSGMQKLISSLSLDRVVLETDAPFLTPVPYRGQRNESAYLCHIAQTIADIKGIQTAEVAAITSANAKRLFNLV